ncbi:meiotic RNA-binding protein 1 [Schizosaccharomyces cryophilus OY26]|uniref:Meiotic RNA-binding protein 1 n=1 Tax=Schizosaccharomyces cryophilus (strain OY26 / ATCC MYA-4695 / CBS 11777 / NBRC 106824 / NRRL Y48691) TaxID=653667 RepID=S9XCQ8_SCHCR|nr:meiotic RNA-binding protein 1 [Schizosaccharomyces cryophilus OY26]EPY51641.1 meiotic RNA-binding protein 1 [Schizosaccharomyces cryophilus OY26]
MQELSTPTKDQRLMSSSIHDPLSTTELPTPTSQTTVELLSNDIKKTESMDSGVVLLTPGTSPHTTRGSSDMVLSSDHTPSSQRRHYQGAHSQYTNQTNGYSMNTQTEAYINEHPNYQTRFQESNAYLSNNNVTTVPQPNPYLPGSYYPPYYAASQQTAGGRPGVPAFRPPFGVPAATPCYGAQWQAQQQHYPMNGTHPYMKPYVSNGVTQQLMAVHAPQNTSMYPPVTPVGQPNVPYLNQPAYLPSVPPNPAVGNNSSGFPAPSTNMTPYTHTKPREDVRSESEDALRSDNASKPELKQQNAYLTRLVSMHPAIPPAIPSMFPISQEEKKTENPGKTKNVYIRGLPPTTTDESLLLYCNRFGKVVSSKAIIDVNNNLCKGFGFACFEELKSAVLCISAMTLCGYQCSFAKESFSARLQNLQDKDSTNLYISNLPLHWNEDDISNLFKPHRIVSNRVLRDSKNQSRGVGFARMQDRFVAEEIIDSFNDYCIDPTLPPLQIRFADSAEQKKFKGQTQKRRMWRAREYNVLTKSITALNDAYSNLDRTETPPVSMYPKMNLYMPVDNNVYATSPVYDNFNWQNMYPPASAYPVNAETSIPKAAYSGYKTQKNIATAGVN